MPVIAKASPETPEGFRSRRATKNAMKSTLDYCWLNSLLDNFTMNEPQSPRGQRAAATPPPPPPPGLTRIPFKWNQGVIRRVKIRYQPAGLVLKADGIRLRHDPGIEPALPLFSGVEARKYFLPGLGKRVI